MIRVILCASLLRSLCLHAQKIPPWLPTPAVVLPDTRAKQVKKAPEKWRHNQHAQRGPGFLQPWFEMAARLDAVAKHG